MYDMFDWLHTDIAVQPKIVSGKSYGKGHRRANDKQKLTAFNRRVAKRRKHNKESRKARKRARR